MKSKLAKALIVLTILLSLSCLLPQSLSANFSISYQLPNHPTGTTHYKLNVAVSESLQQYYLEKTHRANSVGDLAKFVTPYALKPIADSLWQIYNDDEDFVNGALMIVHQIPYEETVPSKYPVETIVANKGDCDLFSYIAASIIKAGGLDVVLLYFESEAHMNIGVSLLHEPRDARGTVEYVTNEGVKFYMAEATGGDWQNGWRVGEGPDSLRGASVQVITLETAEQSAPGQVSASYKSLEASSLTFDISSAYIIQGTPITLSGQLLPAVQNGTVTIYIKANGLPWAILDTIATDSSGRFRYVWDTEVAGISYLRASWSGNEDYAAADSQTLTLTVMSMFFVSLLAMTVILTGVGIAIFFMSRRTHQGIPEPQPPEIPS